jgi:alkanesulfonate monooxygenase SsuD/methylene tetrahydromethanopterin reductase-like flavin-dependent oxidoreductase (luciferase family)
MPHRVPAIGLSDEEARRIAEQLVREVRQPPDVDNREASAPSVGSQSPEDPDEDRIERALIEMGAVSVEQTAVGTRDEAPRSE